ncbi:DUF917 domain-containing protein [Actinobacteria bacterium YIM 96077]|uniref:DUF917 domain-containing protein n=1 Tax=Phytoactinopolyspora halophila TaxID=1981511 RepID=A0A329R0D9_9ACTN|nr:DUF917 domain-containing protein [Phytoactinopolyspora halophila]AYY11428.1 DUF917 domain-containing protein [Actinobacteria bacterium YIM 96077]RAW18090.1 DUF917 domain-containing protein [Phytoactinopolyspora halophila]
MSWTLTAADLPDLARGATLLGTGGGGDPYIGRLLVASALGNGGGITMLDPDDPDDVADDALVIPTAMMGAPTIMLEKISHGREPILALRTLEDRLGEKAQATMPIECGGINSMMPLFTAAMAGLPCVDADGMGRAFPELQMETFYVYGVSSCPMSIAASDGSTIVIDTGMDAHQMEWISRGVTIRLGGASHIADYPMRGSEVKRTAIPRTISLGLRLGRCIRVAREQHRNPFEALRQELRETLYTYGVELFRGKVADVARRTEGGFVRGDVTLRGFDNDDVCEISFQNENLICRVNGTTRALVPDLISVLDVDTGEPITTEGLKFGQRVVVFAISTPASMRSPQALEIFGPQAFGLTEEFIPVEQRNPDTIPSPA